MSETVTNAVEHGGGVVAAQLRLDAQHLRFAVADRSLQLPSPQDPDPWDTSGRGVRLIDELADRWGVEVDHEADGVKRVWFEVHRVGRLRPAADTDPADA